MVRAIATRPGGGDEIPVCLAYGNPYKRLRHY
jgi:hypothetical protein